MMPGSRSAFTTQIRGLDEHINLDATDYHLIPYVTGGLGRLIHLIREDKVPDLPEFGHHTDSDGHFSPQGACLMALRYGVKQILDSKGQSAVLVLAEDLFQKNRLVVIKVLHTQFYKLGVQETHVLWRLAMTDPPNHSHTLRLLTTFTFDGHYCLVFEPLLPDPLTIMFQEFPKHKVLSNLKKVGLRLLATMGFLHQQNLIHTDLKPDNILLKYENDLDSVHIVDFGNTINYVHSEVSLYYKDFELQTPLYRAPEVIFGVPFGPEIDIWSLGCIFAELYLGKPLFLGEAMEDILKQMCELLGPCPAKLFRRGKFFRNLKQYTSNEDQVNASTKIFEHLQLEDYLFADLLAGMLRYSPDERLTASKAAQHPFFASHFPVAFLLPSSTGTSVLSSVPLSQDTYSFSPNIATDIKKGQPSSVDLLRLGTSGIHPTSDLEETVILKPSPRYKMKGENLSIFEEQTHLFPATTGIGSTSMAYKHSDNGCNDVPFVKNEITESKEAFSAGNVKEKMSTLLKAIRREQNLVENDLEKRFEDKKIAGSFKAVKPTDSSVSVKPIPRYGAYRDDGAYRVDTIRKLNRVEQSFKDLQTVSRKHQPSHETTKVEEKQSAITTNHETFLVKTERSCSLKADHGKSSTEIVGQHSSREQNNLRRQSMDTVGRKEGLDDRTFTLQRSAASDQSDRTNVTRQTTGARIKISNSPSVIIDSPNKASAMDVSLSPGFTPSRTKYTPRVFQKDAQDMFRLKNSSSVSSSSLSSAPIQTRSVEEGEEIESCCKTSAESLNRKFEGSSSRSQSKTTHPDGTKTPGRRLTEITSEGRKRAYADCLSDDEVIDVLSPITFGSVRKRQKQLNTGQEKRKCGLYNKYRDDVLAKSNDDPTDNYDSSYAATGISDKRIAVSRKSNAAIEKMYTLSREVNYIECVGIDKDEKRYPRVSEKTKMSYLMTVGRDKNNENLSSDQEQSLTEIDRDEIQTSENESGSPYDQATVMASATDLYQDQTHTNNAQRKSKFRQFKPRTSEMPTPISKVPQAAGVMVDIADDSPEIIYKSFKCRSRENIPRTWKQVANNDNQVYHKHVGTGYAREWQFGEAPTRIPKVSVSTDNRRRKLSSENRVQKNSKIVKDTTQHLKCNFKSESNDLPMGFQKPDKFTFIGTPASDIKNEGRLAQRIVERNKKFKKKARKSLNFQESEGDLDDESSDDSENSKEEFVDESLVETSNRVYDPALFQPMKKTVKKTSNESRYFYRQNDPKGRTSIESQRRSSEITNSKGKGMMEGNRHSKCDTTFVLDFESPQRHTKGKK